VQLVVDDVSDVAACRLSQNGKHVPAQFRSLPGKGRERAAALDFSVSLDPLEAREYEIRVNGTTEPNPEPRRGLQITEGGGIFRIGGSGTEYEVPVNLAGFLRQVRQEGKRYLGPSSKGLWIRLAGRDAKLSEPRDTVAHGSIQRAGPLAVGLGFTAEWIVGTGRVPAVVELTFPSSKSWVELNWTVPDRARQDVKELGLDLDLAIDGSPTLIDLGATGTVYSTIQGEERIWLEGSPRAGWDIFKQTGTRVVLQATSRREPAGSPHPAEGWAHVMDANRCTAVAVADFGLQSRDRIEISAAGQLRLTRSFDDATQGSRSLRAWFHFVGMPVQVGAVTSPQSMLAPLKIEWL
jgi:hypothetical protein